MKKFWILNLFVGLTCLLLGFILLTKNLYIISGCNIIIGFWNLYYVYIKWKK